jgi:hypothetical protein
MGRRNEMKKWIPTILACLIFLPGYGAAFAEEKPNPPIKLDVDEDGKTDFLITVEGWSRFTPPKVEQKEYQQATYTTYTYEDEGGQTKFTLTLVKTAKNDVLFFGNQQQSEKPVTTYMTVQINDPYISHQYLIPEDGENYKGQWQGWYSEAKSAPMPIRPVYAQGSKLNGRIGSIDLYTPQGDTVIKLVGNIPVNRIKNEKDTRYQFQLPGKQQEASQTWGILSTRPLIQNAIPEAAKLAQQMDKDTFRKLGVDGLYETTPLTYFPSSPDSYYRNPANITGLRHVFDSNQAQYGGLTYAMVTHLAYVAVQNQNEQGYWETAPRSNWLFQDYQIDSHYFDNRRNADNATFLLRYNRMYPDPVIQQALEKWESFLYKYIDKTSLQTENGGYLLSDYVDASMEHVSHTALNHHIAILNYLLESNLYAPNDEKREYIDLLQRGIEDTQDLWIKPNSDLYYALYRDLTPHAYPDYYSLTLEDMILTQALLRQNNLPENEAIKRLMDAKRSWMDAQQAQQRTVTNQQ